MLLCHGYLIMASLPILNSRPEPDSCLDFGLDLGLDFGLDFGLDLQSLHPVLSTSAELQ